VGQAPDRNERLACLNASYLATFFCESVVFVPSLCWVVVLWLDSPVVGLLDELLPTDLPLAKTAKWS